MTDLNSQLMTEAFLYKPDNCRFMYLVKWEYGAGYRLQRRPRKEERRFTMWPHLAEVEDYIQSNGGEFYPSSAARPIVRWDSRDEAEEIIRNDVLLNVFI